jgi:hypothetical protein
MPSMLHPVEVAADEAAQQIKNGFSAGGSQNSRMCDPNHVKRAGRPPCTTQGRARSAPSTPPE